MTQEEKAKHYDEAIKYGQYLINERCKDGTDGSFHRADLQKMFPELKESEDERIRKNIIIALMSQQDNLIDFYKTHNTNEKELIAWVKKQGEQNPAEEYNITGIGSKNAQGKLGEMIKNLKPVNEVLEQKPAEYNKEIPTNLKDIVDKEANAIWKEESTDGCHLVIDSFNMFYGICMQIAEAVVDYRKPAWSEEDKDYYDAIIAKLEVTQEDAALTDNQMEFLKSLKKRYAWKPSEEQINALEYYIYSTSPTATITKGTIYGNLMVELLEQLKKLREE